MFEAETEVVDLHARLGRVGSIQAWNPWNSRRSVEDAKWWVAKVASLSYGNEEAKNPEKLFQSIVERGHLSCLEFVPFRSEENPASLPGMSLRSRGIEWLKPHLFTQAIADLQSRERPASAFLVECPLYIRSQWMRHRAFSYLEMSRRYTKGSRVAWEFYGAIPMMQMNYTTGPDMGWKQVGTEKTEFHAACEAEYQRRLDAGWPNEIARGCMPMEAMTKFWVAGFDRDWEAFLKLRADAHAQEEIRVFAEWIKGYLEKKGSAHA